MNKSIDFYNMTHFTISIFQQKLVNPIKHILNKSERQITAYLYNDNEVSQAPTLYGRPKKYSPEDRMFRTSLIANNANTKLVSYLFGCSVSTTLKDAWLIVRVYYKVMGFKLNLPTKGTLQYKLRRGIGVFKGIFDSGVYIMDGHEV